MVKAGFHAAYALKQLGIMQSEYVAVCEDRRAMRIRVGHNHSEGSLEQSGADPAH